MAETHVFIVEQGEYSDRGIVGVFATAEAAMNEWPKDKWTTPKDCEPGEYWQNQRTFDNRRVINRYEVKR